MRRMKGRVSSWSGWRAVESGFDQIPLERRAKAFEANIDLAVERGIHGDAPSGQEALEGA